MANIPTTSSDGPPYYHTVPQCHLGESPIYRHGDHTLHWIDLMSTPCNLHILQLSPSTLRPLGSARIVSTSLPVTMIRFIKGRPGKYICGYRNGWGLLDEVTGEVEVRKELIGNGVKGCMMNDGAVDAQGRLWIGEVDLHALNIYSKGEEGPRPRGRLWRIEVDGEARVMANGIMVGNGIGWSPDGKSMYVCDSGPQILWKYDFDVIAGSISKGTKLINGLPGNPKGVLNDGLVVDKEGNIWIAMWMDHSILVFSPTGKPIKRIAFPAKCITCPAWGGPNNDVLFVTTAQPLVEQQAVGDEGGHIFKYEPGVQGMINHEYGHRSERAGSRAHL